MSDGGYKGKCEDYGFNTGEFSELLERNVMRAYTADFETTTDVDDCRVWAWCVCEIDNPEMVEYGNDVDGFIRWCNAAANCQMYFHNLAFDGAFIMDYLERHGWKWIDDRAKAHDKTYTTLISDANQVYMVTLYFEKSRKVVIYDSLKIVPLSVAQMAKSYGLDEGKGSLDYTAHREIGHELTDDEKDYIRRDVQIVAKVMKIFLEGNLTKMTAGSNALHDYKQMLGGYRKFRYVYPIIEKDEDDFIRKAYRGGFTYCNPDYAGVEIGEGIVLDVNSLYPSVMASCDGQMLPIGKPIWFDGEYQHDKYFPLWVACVNCRFKLKEKHIPCIQLKGNFRYGQTEYITDSKGEVTFMVSSVDWDLINQQYDVKDVTWLGGYMFQASDMQFKSYVDKWTQVKVQATIDGNKGRRQIAKLMLNSLYGKFATRIEIKGRRPVLIDDVLKYADTEPEQREPVYLPVGVFITAHARYKTITSAQKVYDRFVYADTDSLHLIGTDLPDCLDIDPIKLGAWKHEMTFDRAKYLRAKTYMEECDGKLIVHVAGMPSKLHPQVTFDNFNLGAKYYGKLYQKRVIGGIVLVEGDMEIRA